MIFDINSLLTDDQRTELTKAAHQTLVAAAGNSNDAEIAVLQEFRDLACEVLGIELDHEEDF